MNAYIWLEYDERVLFLGLFESAILTAGDKFTDGLFFAACNHYTFFPALVAAFDCYR